MRGFPGLCACAWLLLAAVAQTVSSTADMAARLAAERAERAEGVRT